MSNENLLSRRQVLGLFGSTGAAIVGVAEGLNQDGDGGGNVYGGIMALSQAYQAGDNLWHGPLSARSEVPQKDGNAYIQTDAGGSNDQYKIFHYDSDAGGWVARGFNTPALATDQATINNADGSTIDGDNIIGFPSSSVDAGLVLGGGWTTIDANRPVQLAVVLRASTDGTSTGDVTLKVDESGGTAADQTVARAYADSTHASGTLVFASGTITLPAGATVNVDNASDPTGDNQLNSDKAWIL